MMRFKDNSDIEEILPSWASNLANVELSKLSDDILIFPPISRESTDLSDDQLIFEFKNNKYRTTNIMGLLGKGNEQITIHSRFDDGQNDFFLRYMLEKVFDANIVNFDLSKGRENIFDLLPFLLPTYLENALKKGIYKTYVKKQYNDSQVRGPINIGQHIKKNTPFIGKISYDIREFTSDNNIMQLIRHTIEYVRLTKKSIKFPSNLIKKVEEVTQTYQLIDRNKILSSNLTIKNPYFCDYNPLIRLCQMILRHEKVSFGDDKQKIHGIIFDGAWLWEEYLARVIDKALIHSENKTHKSSIKLFQTMTQGKNTSYYPDFYVRNVIVLDAKYKNVTSIKREDRFQIITYLHVLSAHTSGVIFPSRNTTYWQKIGELSGFGGNIGKLSVSIPQKFEQYSIFRDRMGNEEILLKECLSNLI